MTNNPSPAETEHQEPANFVEFLEQHPLVAREDLLPHRPVPCDPNVMPNLGSTHNRTYGISMELKAVLKAGDESFSIIAATAHGQGYGDEEIVIARFPQGDRQRAEVVSTLRRGQELIVGRPNLGLSGFENVSRTLSREHFRVGLSVDGMLDVTDLDSSNGTKLLAHRQHELGEIKAPKGMYKQWSPEAEDVKEAIRVPKKQHRAGKVIVEVAGGQYDSEAPKQEQRQTRDEKLAELTKGLDESDLSNLFKYGSYKLQKRSAQDAGDGHTSTLMGQYAGEALLALSPKAKEIAETYARVFASN